MMEPPEREFSRRRVPCPASSPSRRAFAVLGTLGDGPLGVTEVAERADLPKSTAARLLATLVGEGAVEQVPGDTAYRLGPRLITLAGGFSLARSLAAIARPMLIELAEVVGRGGGPRRCRTATSSTTSTRSTRVHPVLVRDWTGVAGAAPCRVVGPGPAGVPHAGRDRALSRAADGAVHGAHAGRPRRRARAVARDPPATATPGRSRSSTPASRRSRHRSPTHRARSIAAVHVHGPSYRFPAAGSEADLAQVLLAGAARIAAGLRET